MIFGWSKPQKELKAFSFYRFQDSIMHEIAWVWPWQVFKKESSMMINLPFISRCSFKRWKIAVLPKSSWKIGWKEKKKLYNFWKRKFNRQLGFSHLKKERILCGGAFNRCHSHLDKWDFLWGTLGATIFRFLYPLWLLQSAVAKKSFLKICGVQL